MTAIITSPLLLWTLITYRPCTSDTTTTVAPPKIITPFDEITASPTFVDKTLFIKLILEKELSYNGYYIMTCPRGFGKTVNIDMLRKFVELPTDQSHKPLADAKKRKTDSYKLFTDAKLKLAISRDRPFINEHFGKYATIYFDFDIADCTTYSEIFAQVCHKIGQLFEQYRWLYEEKYAQATDESRVKALFESFYASNVTENDIRDSLRELAIILNRKYNAPVFVLIDNYDTPIAKAIRNGAATTKVHALISDTMKNLLNDTSEIVSHFLLTGVSSTFASYMAVDCRDMKALSFLQRSRFGKYFGFTDDDMAKLYAKFKIQPAERNAIYQHYGGYRTETGIVHTHDEAEQESFFVHNPFSVCAYFKERPEGDLQTYNFHTYWSDKDDPTVLTNVHWLRNVFLRDHVDEIVIANRVPFLAHMVSPGKDLRNLEKMFGSMSVCEGYKGLSYMLHLYDMGYLTNYVKNYLQPPNPAIRHRFQNYLRAYITEVLNITDTKIESIANGVRGIVENSVTTDQMRNELTNALQHDDILAFAFERDNKRYSYLYKKNDLSALLYIAIDTHARQHFANVSTNVILQRIGFSERNLFKVVQTIPTADFLITSKDEQCVSCFQITHDGNTTAIVEPLKNYTRFMFAKQPKYLKYLTINMQDRAIQVESCPTMQFIEEQWMVL